MRYYFLNKLYTSTLLHHITIAFSFGCYKKYKSFKMNLLSKYFCNIFTTQKIFMRTKYTKVMRGNDVVLKLHEKLN